MFTRGYPMFSHLPSTAADRRRWSSALARTSRMWSSQRRAARLLGEIELVEVMISYVHKQQDGSNLKLDIDFFSYPSVRILLYPPWIPVGLVSNLFGWGLGVWGKQRKAYACKKIGFDKQHTWITTNIWLNIEGWGITELYNVLCGQYFQQTN